MAELHMEENVHLGFAVFLTNEQVHNFVATLGKELPKEFIQEFMDEPEEFDPEEPTEYINDYITFYEEYLEKHYPKLAVSECKFRTGALDGLTVYVEDSYDMLCTTREFELPEEPTARALEELTEFRDKFAPDASISWKQWITFSL